jgi:hypothetical protein
VSWHFGFFSSSDFESGMFKKPSKPNNSKFHISNKGREYFKRLFFNLEFCRPPRRSARNKGKGSNEENAQELNIGTTLIRQESPASRQDSSPNREQERSSSSERISKQNESSNYSSGFSIDHTLLQFSC